MLSDSKLVKNPSCKNSSDPRNLSIHILNLNNIKHQNFFKLCLMPFYFNNFLKSCFNIAQHQTHVKLCIQMFLYLSFLNASIENPISYKYKLGKGIIICKVFYTRLSIYLELDTKIWVMKVSQKSYLSDESFLRSINCS